MKNASFWPPDHRGVFDILTAHGVAFEVMTADVDERLDGDTDPASACMYLALKKALAVKKKTRTV